MAEEFKALLSAELESGALDAIQKQIDSLGKDIILSVKTDKAIRDVATLKSFIKELKKETKGISLDNIFGKELKFSSSDFKKLDATFEKLNESVDSIKKAFESLGSNNGLANIGNSIENANKSLSDMLAQFRELNALINTKSFEFKFNVGSGNTTAAYGVAAKQGIVEMRQQAAAIEDAFLTAYSAADGFNAVFAAAAKTNLFDKILKVRDSFGRNENKLVEAEAYRDYIKLLQELARIEKVNISQVVSGFDKSADEIVQHIERTLAGTEQVEQNVERLRGIFGGGIGAEELVAQIDRIITKLDEVQTTLSSLGENINFDQMIDPINRLSESINNLLNNAVVIRNALGNGFDTAGSQISNTADRIERLSDIDYSVAETGIERVREAAESIGMSQESIDAVVDSFNNLGIVIKQVTSSIDDNNHISLKVDGVDQLGRDVSVFSNLFERRNPDTKALELVNEQSVRIKQSFDEIDNSFKQLLGTIKQIGSLEGKLVLLDADENAAEIDYIQNRLAELYATRDQLYSFEDSFSSDQNRALNEATEAVINNVSQLEAKLADTNFNDAVNSGFRELLSTIQRIGELEGKLIVLDGEKNTNEINTVQAELRNTYDLMQKIADANMHLFTEDQKRAIDSALDVSTNKNALKAAQQADKQAEAKANAEAKAAEKRQQQLLKINESLDTGAFKKKEAELISGLSKITNASAETKAAIDEFSLSLKRLESGDAVGISKIFEAEQLEKNYKKAKNLMAADTMLGKQDPAVLQGYKQVKSLLSEIYSLEQKLVKGDKDTQEYAVLEARLRSVNEEYAALVSNLSRSLTSDQLDSLNEAGAKLEHELALVKARFEDVSASKLEKQLENINDGLDLGGFKKQLQTVQNSFDKVTLKTEEAEIAVKEFEAAFKAMLAAQKSGNNDELIKSFEAFEKAKRKAENFVAIDAGSKKNVLTNEINTWLDKNKNAAEGVRQELEKLRDKLKECDDQDFDHIQKSAKDLMDTLDQAKDSTVNLQGVIVDLAAKYLSFADICNYIQRAFSAMYENVLEIDTAMTNLYKVTDETANRYDKFLTTAAKKSKDLGRNMASYIEQTADWTKLGFTLDEAEQLSELSSVYANVGEVDDATAVSDMVTAMKAFNIEATDAVTIIDSLNELGNRFATNAADLGTGLTKSASAMNAAGADMHETLAMLTGVTEITQNASEAGNFLKVASMRVRGMKGELEELGEEVDETVDSISKVQTQILNRTGGKINIFDDAGQFRNYYDIMKDIAAIWDDLNSRTQADLSEILFGKMRGNQGQALIQAFKSGRIEAALLASSVESVGSAMEEQEKWMESLEAKLGSLDAVIQKISENVLDSDLLKGGVDLLTGFLSIIEEITGGLGSLGTLLIALPIGIFAGGAVNELVRLATAAAKTAEGFNLLGSVGPALKVGFNSVTKSVGGLKGAFVALGKAIATNPILAIATGVLALISVIEAVHVSASEAAENFEEAITEYESAKQQVLDINTELENTKTKIDELQRKGGLTFVEQAELERLQKVTAELELQAQFAKEAELKAARELAQSSVDAYTKNYDNWWHGGDIEESRVATHEDRLRNATVFTIDAESNDLNELVAAYRIFSEQYEEALASGDESLKWKKQNLTNVSSALWEDFQNIDKWRRAILEIPEDLRPVGWDESLKTMTDDWEYLYELLNPAGFKQYQFDSLFDIESYAKAKNALLEIASANKTVGITADDVKAQLGTEYSNFVSELWAIGLEIQDFIDNINSEAGAINIEVADEQVMDAFYAANGIDPKGDNEVGVDVEVGVNEKPNKSGLTASQLMEYLDDLSEEDKLLFYSLKIDWDTATIENIESMMASAKLGAGDEKISFADLMGDENYLTFIDEQTKKANALKEALAAIDENKAVDYQGLSELFKVPVTEDTDRTWFEDMLESLETETNETIDQYVALGEDAVTQAEIASQKNVLKPVFTYDPEAIDPSQITDYIEAAENLYSYLEDGIERQDLMKLAFEMPELGIDWTVPEDQLKNEAESTIDSIRVSIDNFYGELYKSAKTSAERMAILNQRNAAFSMLDLMGVKDVEFDFDDTSELRGIVSGLQDKLEQVLSGELTEAEKSSMVVDLLEDHKDALLEAGITDLNTSNLEESLNTLIKAYQDQIVEALKAAREALDDGDHIEEVKLLDQAITAYEEEILANMPTAKEHKLDASAISGYISDIEGMYGALEDGVSGLELYELSLKYPELNIDYTVPEAQYEAEVQKAITALKASIESVYNKMIESAETFAEQNYWYKQKQNAMIQIDGIGIEVEEFDSSVISDLRGNINDLQDKLIEVYSGELTDSEKADMATELWEDYWQDFEAAGIDSLDASNLEEGITLLIDKYKKDIDAAFEEAIEALRGADKNDLADALEEFWGTVQKSLEFVTPEASKAAAKTGGDDIEDAVDDYVSNIEKLYDSLGKVRSGEFTSEDLFNLQKIFGDAINPDDLEGTINTAINNTIGELDEAYEKLYMETQDPKWLALKESAHAWFAEMAEVPDLSFNIETEAEGFNALYSAIGASSDALGVNSEAVQNLIERYKTLKDFNVDELFEYTSAGIRINTKYVQELEGEYQKLAKTKLTDRLEDLRDELERNQDELKRTGKLSDGMRETDAIIKDIQNVQSLIGEYDGLISKYNRWKQLQSQPDTGSQFRDIVEGKEELDKLAKEGAWGSQYLQSYLDMFSYTPIEDYETKYKSLDDTIKGTSFSLSDFIKGGGEGVTNLLKAMEQIDPESINFDGNQWNINATAAEMELLASKLGVSTEFIEHAFEQIRYLGGNLQIIDAVDDLETLTEKADIVNEALKEVGKEPLKINFDANAIEDIDTEIGKIKKSIGDLTDVDENGEITLKPGVSQAEYNFAMDMLEYMAQKKAELVAPGLMSIQVEATDGLSEIEKAVLLMQQLNTQLQIGTDTKEAQTEIQNILTQLSGLSEETKAKLGLDTDEFTTAVNSLTETSITPGISLNADDIAIVQSTLTGISADVIATISINDEEVKGYSAPDKRASVIYNVNDRKVSSYDPPDKYATVYYSYKTHGASPVNGTAHYNGTAFAHGIAYRHGDWGTKGSGVALGGELGMETIVRDGRYYTIGNNGAEFFQYKKGDIIFNHKQTEELFKYGKVTSGGGRGKAFAEGTAFSDGIGYEGSWTGVSGSSSSSSGSKKSNSSSSKSTSSNDDFKEIFDWIEIAIDRIERKIESLGRKAENVFKSWNDRNDKLRDQMHEVANEIDLQNQAADRYLEEANSVGLDEKWAKLVREGAVDIDTITDEDLADKIQQYQEWYDKYLDCIDAAEELKVTESELYQQAFDNIVTQYEDFISVIEQEKSLLEEYISQAEEKGQIASANYYQALIASERNNLSQLESEREALVASLNEAVASGKIDEGSEAWYEMVGQINDVTLAIAESETAMLEYNNAIRDIEWQVFDLMQEKISQVSSEADFLISLLENDKLYNDKGQLTDEGMATMAMHGMNYDTYMHQADEYAKEMAKINAELANDPNNQDLLNRRQELLELQQESILAAEDEKQAIIDMVSEGIQLELDALKELISSYTDALDAEKSLYDYQKKVKGQVEEIASLEKQLAAYAGDQSEEARLKLQEIRVSLEEARENLEETEYERYISDQKELLDELYDDYDEVLNSRLDNVDALLEDMISTINANAETIHETLTSASGNVGYTLSSTMTSIWGEKDATGKITNAIGIYSNSINSEISLSTSRLTTALNAINSSVQEMVSAWNAQAAAQTNTGISTGTVNGTGTTGAGAAINTGSGTNGANDETIVEWHGTNSTNGNHDDYKDAMLNIIDTVTKSNNNSQYLTDLTEDIAFDVKKMAGAFGLINHSSRDILEELGVDRATAIDAVNNGWNNLANNSFAIEITLPNVTNYDEFKQKMQRDKSFENMFRAMTTDRMFGGSSLKKYRY